VRGSRSNGRVSWRRGAFMAGGWARERRGRTRAAGAGAGRGALQESRQACTRAMDRKGALELHSERIRSTLALAWARTQACSVGERRRGRERASWSRVQQLVQKSTTYTAALLRGEPHCCHGLSPINFMRGRRAPRRCRHSMPALQQRSASSLRCRAFRTFAWGSSSSSEACTLQEPRPVARVLERAAGSPRLKSTQSM